MLTHRCLDPQDPYGEREVRVAFEWVAGGPRLIAAFDELQADILPDLVEAQCDDLRREIVTAVPGPETRPIRTAEARVSRACEH
ncbi:hypothetical protein GOFOIKOB_4841 [Methylobacterium tardum]|jgi:hypothetical protein|uniref:Uncharacterized protein n=1 Tax=Methylobacterium tardum TaxID=374432 RepID=A0AA37TF94_9HYPH|nr:hypothetical protein [Methylobacterium tardum]URD37307.1 hypothetical protein M6G65_01500 [Methylobacterium tardum]GJE51778.1 hypothetical protein GOFOIKOB_4841 [Methylobacterium tardum]GLS70807.1 hypothetical protein GCM10007890_28200 [Methylobacterium tardum]